MKPFKPLFVLTVFSLLFACGGSDDGPSDPDPDPTTAPSATTLVFPENNSECTEGKVLSASESEVVFQWNAAENTDSYTVNLRNLDTDGTQEFNANTNELAIRLDRGTPYSWSVISRATGTIETAESATWRFYNAGPGIENYSPFPADNPSPKSGVAVNPGTITLEWVGSDLDDDIVSYEVLLSTNNPPTTSIGETTVTTLDVDVTASTIQYWRVITTDATNNSSQSEIFQFRVN